MKRLLLVVPIACLTVAGCNSGETPIETVKIDKAQPAKPDSVGGAIQSNPNMPDAAKKALLGGKQ